MPLKASISIYMLVLSLSFTAHMQIDALKNRDELRGEKEKCLGHYVKPLKNLG